MNKLLTYAALIVQVSGCNSLGITEQKVVSIDTSRNTRVGLEIASFPTQLRASYVYTTAAGIKVVCAEPFSDVAASSSLNATAGAINKLSDSLKTSINQSGQYSREGSGSNTSDSSSSSSSGKTGSDASSGRAVDASNQADQNINLGMNAVNQIVALEGRTQFVLLAREMLFRTCEAAANGHLADDKTAVYKQHEQIFKALTTMLDTQKAHEESQKAEAEAEKAKAIAKVAEKLDPKILRIFGNGTLNDLMLENYMNELTGCLDASGKDQSKKDKCKKDYSDKLKKLSGG
jgi:hypothetical protein